MSPAEDELRDFTQFVHGRISAGNAGGLGLPELFDLWLLEHPAIDEHKWNVAAINASISDYLNGERGTVAGEHSQELRKNLGPRGS